MIETDDDPRLRQLRAYLAQRPDIKLKRLQSLMAAQRAVTPGQKETAAAMFGPVAESSGDQGFFQTPETTAGGSDREYQGWLDRNQVTDADNPDAHYDYRGAFLAGVNRDPSGHFPDTFKQHGHPTFSVESKYSQGPNDGGRWQGDAFKPQSPRVLGASEEVRTKPEGGFKSYAKQAAVGAAGGLARFVPSVAIATGRDIARTGSTVADVLQGSSVRSALERATQEQGGGVDGRWQPLPSARGSMFERAQEPIDAAITAVQDRAVGKPKSVGDVAGRQTGELIGSVLPLAPMAIRGGGALLGRILKRAEKPVIPPPPDPAPISSHVEPAPPVEPTPTTSLRSLGDVQKDLAGAKAAQVEAVRRGATGLAHEYQKQVFRLMSEAKKMGPGEVPTGEPIPPKPPAVKTPALGLFQQSGKTPEELEQILHPSKGLPPGVSSPKQRTSVEKITNEAIDQSAVDELVGEQTAAPVRLPRGQPDVDEFAASHPAGPGELGLKPGDVVKTSYGTGPYRIVSISKGGTEGYNVADPMRPTKWPHPVYSLTLEDPKRPIGRGGANTNYINELYRGADGKLYSGHRGDMVEQLSPDQLPARVERKPGPRGKPEPVQKYAPAEQHGQGGGVLPQQQLRQFSDKPYREARSAFQIAKTPEAREAALDHIATTFGPEWRAAVEREDLINRGPQPGSAPKKPTPLSDRITGKGEGQPAVRDLEGKIWTRKEAAEHGDLAGWAEDQGAQFSKKPDDYSWRGWILDGKFVSLSDLDREQGVKAVSTLKPKQPADRRPTPAIKAGQTAWPKTGERYAGELVHREVKPGTPFEEGYPPRDAGDVDIRIPKLGTEVTARDQQGQPRRGHVNWASGEHVRVHFPDGSERAGHFADVLSDKPGTPQAPKIKGNAMKGVPLEEMELDALEKEFVRLEKKTQRTGPDDTRMKHIERELDRRDAESSKPESAVDHLRAFEMRLGATEDRAGLAQLAEDISAARNIPGTESIYSDLSVLRGKVTRKIKKLPPDEPAGPSGSARKKPVEPEPTGDFEMGDAYEPPVETTAAPSNPKYKKLDDQALLARRHELMDRMDKANRAIKLHPYVGENQYGGTRPSGMSLGRKGDHGATGRAMGRLKDDGRLVNEIDAELKARGMPDDQVSRAYDDYLEQVEAAKQAEKDKPWVLPDGTVLSHGAIPGAIIGGALGAAASEDENKFGGALTGALAGGFAGHILTRASIARGTQAVFQRAVADPDVSAVLSISATPRKGAARTLAGAKASFLSGVRTSYQAMLDDVYSARRFGRDVGKTEAVSDEASRARGWRTFGDELIGRTKPWRTYQMFSHLPTLRKAVTASKGHEAEVIALTRAERAIELDDAGMGWKLEGHATRQQAEAAVKKLSVIPAARAGANQLRDFYNHLYDLRYEHGLISKAEYVATKAKHTQFVSFLRDFGNEGGANAGSAGGKLFMRGSTVRKMEAQLASSPIVDPFQQAAQDAYRVARAVSRQRVFNVISDIVQRDPAGAAPWLTDFGVGTKGVPRGYEGRTIQARVKGELHLYGINDYDFFNALSAITPESRDIAHWLLTFPKKTLQAGTTIVPSFGAANASRDAFFTSLSYKFPKMAGISGALAGAAIGATQDPDDPFKGAAIGAGLGLGVGVMSQHAGRIIRAFGSIARNDDLYQVWKRQGGSGAGYFVQTKQDAERAVAQLRHDHVTPLDLVNPKTWWEALENLNRMVEEAPRLAKFKSEFFGLKKPLANAIATSRNVSLDFSRHGGSDIARLSRETSAFWNPKMQGLDKLREVFFGPNKGRAYLIGVTAMTAPTVALWMINRDDPEYLRRPLYEKMLAWHVPVGKDERGVTKFFLLPKPFEPGYVFASLPQLLLDFAYKHDKERTMAGLKQVAGSVGEGLLPVPTAIQPVLENRAGKQGYSQFRGRPIVDDALSKLPPREQIDSRTSTAAIALSRAAELGTFGLYSPSPKKVDNVIQGWTGKGGRIVTTKIDELLHRSGMSSRPVAPARNTSQWARFVTQEAGFNTDDIQTLFRQYEDAAQHLEQVKRLAKEGHPQEARDYALAHRTDLVTARMYAKAVEKYRAIARGRRQIENSRTLTAEEKRDRIAKLGEMASALAKRAVDARLTVTQGSR